MKTHSMLKTKQTPVVLHRSLVDQIVAAARPARLLIRPGVQWLLWLGSSLIVMACFWMKMGVQNNLGQVLQSMPPLVFIITAFVGASLAAWEAIARELPAAPIEFHPTSRRLADDAADFKARFKISLADAFAAALAKEKKGELITGDPEFKPLETEIKINWLPA